jgi:hypothetical protein
MEMVQMASYESDDRHAVDKAFNPNVIKLPKGTLRKVAFHGAKTAQDPYHGVYLAAKKLKPKHFNKLQKLYASAIETQPNFF